MLYAKVTRVRLLNDCFVSEGFGAHFGCPRLSEVCVLCSFVKGGVLVVRPPLLYASIICPCADVTFVFVCV